MKKIDLIAMSVRNLFRRKFRTFLTVLGVIIGSTSIILMLSMGIAMDKNMEEQMERIGNIKIIQLYSRGNSGNDAYDEEDIKTLSEITDVEIVIPRIRAPQIYLTLGKYRTFEPCWSTYVLTPEQIEALEFKIGEGRNFTKEDSEAVIIGPELLMYFTKNGKEPNWDKGWGSWSHLEEIDIEQDKVICDVLEYDYKTGKPVLENETGKFKKPEEIKAKIVGLLSQESSYQQLEAIIITPKLYEKLKKINTDYRKALGYYTDEDKEQDKKPTYTEVWVKVNKRENVKTVWNEIQELGYTGYTDIEYIEQLEEQSKSKQLGLAAIGLVSFVVAAIGIANTMMMSIYERTKEIGVMKVIGAKLKDIQAMFLMESLLIGFFGGVLGSVTSILLSIGLNAGGGRVANMMDMYGGGCVSIITPELIVSGILFSVAVGLLSGFFPARKAMKLSALSAIKTE